MKKLLPILLCHVLMTTQAYAISGGPVFGGNGINPVGTYSGVIVVNTVKDFVLDPDTGSTIVDPVTGLAETTVDDSTVSLGPVQPRGADGQRGKRRVHPVRQRRYFLRATSLPRSIPDSGALSGIVEGTSSFSTTFVDDTGTTEVTVVEVINNSIAGKVVARIAGTRSGTLASASLVGTANLIVNSGGNRVTGGSEQGELVQNFALDCTVTGFPPVAGLHQREFARPVQRHHHPVAAVCEAAGFPSSHGRTPGTSGNAGEVKASSAVAFPVG